MKTPEQLAASIERFREGFWGRRSIGRPPIGVGADRAWQPIGYLRAPLPEGDLAPSAVNHSLVRTDYEDHYNYTKITSTKYKVFNLKFFHKQPFFNKKLNS